MTKKIAIYIRATPEKAKSQLKDMKQLCSKKGWDIFTEYIDDENSYKSWTQLFRDIRLEQFDILLFWKYSDFARVDKNNFKALKNILKNNVGFHSFLEELFSTENLNQQMMLDYLDLFYSVHKNYHSVETKKGQDQSRAAGIHIGRSKIPDEARQKIIELRKLGYSYAKIKSLVTYVDSNKKTCHPSAGTIHNIVRNHANCSKSDVHKKTIFDNVNCETQSKTVLENAGDNS